MKNQYEQVCALDDCVQVLHIDMPIHIWDNNKNGDEWKEMTICDYCHQDLGDVFHSKGWTHDEEEEEEN